MSELRLQPYTFFTVRYRDNEHKTENVIIYKGRLSSEECIMKFLMSNENIRRNDIDSFSNDVEYAHPSNSITEVAERFKDKYIK